MKQHKVREEFLASVIAKLAKKPLPDPLPFSLSTLLAAKQKKEADGRTNNS